MKDMDDSPEDWGFFILSQNPVEHQRGCVLWNELLVGSAHRFWSYVRTLETNDAARLGQALGFAQIDPSKAFYCAPSQPDEAQILSGLSWLSGYGLEAARWSSWVVHHLKHNDSDEVVGVAAIALARLHGPHQGYRQLILEQLELDGMPVRRHLLALAALEMGEPRYEELSLYKRALRDSPPDLLEAISNIAQEYQIPLEDLVPIEQDGE
jgi:hypothetical protein